MLNFFWHKKSKVQQLSKEKCFAAFFESYICITERLSFAQIVLIQQR